MHLAAHLLFEVAHFARIVLVPRLQGRARPGTRQHILWEIRVVRSQFPLRSRLVVAREVAEEQEREHVIAEVVGIHRAAQLVGNVPERFAQLLLDLVVHCTGTSRGAGAGAGGEAGTIPGRANSNRATNSLRMRRKRSLLSSPISVGSWMA